MIEALIPMNMSYPSKLIFHGNEIVFQEKLYRYAAAKIAFEPQIIQTINSAEASFEDNLGDLSHFVENAPSWLRNSLQPLLDFTTEQLALNGCYDLDDTELFRQYVATHMTKIPAIYENMKEELAQIQADQEAENAKRVARRKERVANGGSDLGERIFNGFGRLKDEVVNAGKAALIYNDEVKSVIKRDFQQVCQRMVDIFAEALYASTGSDFQNPITIEEYQKSSIMFNHLRNRKIPEDKIDEVALAIFKMNPLQTGFLDWAVRHYGDADGQLEKAAAALSISIERTKKQLLQEEFDTIDFESEEKLLAGQQRFIQKERDLSIESPELRRKITAKLLEFDLKARTVAGVEYKTRNDAEVAQREKNKIEKICQKHSPVTTCQEYEALIAEIENAAFTSGIEKRIIEDANGKLMTLKKKIIELTELFSISSEQAEAVLDKIALINNLGIKEIRGLEPGSTSANELWDIYGIAEDDFLLGIIDISLTDNGKNGIAITQKGLYMPKSKKGGRRKKIVLFILMLIAIVTIPYFLIFAGFFWLLVKILKKRKAKNAAVSSFGFIPWNQVSASIKGGPSIISINAEHTFKIPFHSDLDGKRVQIVKLLNQFAEKNN